MADEPALPRFPHWDSGSQSFNARKRVRDDDAAAQENNTSSASQQLFFANSSDPAMFSSDDDPNVENYAQGRHRKKRYVGSWFQQQPASGDSAFSEESRLPRPPKGGKRTFERQFDSGVWMGSDGSTDLELDEDLMMPPPPPSRLPQLDLNRGRQALALSRAEELAQNKIFDAVENGTEDVDLSSMNLETLSNATVAPLSELACIPTVAEGVPFEHKDPSLKIYLSQNPLNRVPGALFNLEFLTYLTLRNAKLTEIPPAIGNLRNLQTLNISLNRLRCLPGEILDLVSYPSKLKTLMLHSNHFYSFAGDNFTRETEAPKKPYAVQHQLVPSGTEESEWTNTDDVLSLGERFIEDENSTLKLWLNRADGLAEDSAYPNIAKHRNWTWRARIVARTPVQFEDSRGVVMSKYQLPDHKTTSPGAELATEDLAHAPSTPLAGSSGKNGKASRVPSLLELALKSCSRTTQLPHLPSYLPEDAPAHLPDVLRRIAAQAEANADTGDLPCSKCRKRVIVPVAQWIEWWQLHKLRFHSEIVLGSTIFDNNGTVPFLKRACSYACLPEATETGALLPRTVRYCLQKEES
ncbi:leucine rich repeat family protein [Pestalotiopsis sp. NC0098]|nr:leucine rich repeat family protein [Pestalotiopsis sp. NC0098]